MKLTVGRWQPRFYVHPCISMVLAVANAVFTVGLNAADHRLDIEHYPYLSCLASAYPWTSVGASGLDCGAGVRIRGSVGNYRFAPDHTITAPQCLTDRVE